jgi:dipeptidyl aminopeptidase/acylaminoacyl peptidase
MRILACLLLTPFVWAADAPQTPKPLALADILAWKRIAADRLSDDGKWFVYRLTPNEGDSEVVIRDLNNAKDLKFPAGEYPATSPATALAISDDSKWAAFLTYPTAKEAKALKKQKKPVESKVVLVELATGKKTEFEKMRRFAFSGQKSAVIALHRYSSNPAPATPPPSNDANADTKPQGSDLILYELATANELNLGNVSDFAFTKDGAWLAWVVDAQDQAGNGVNVRNTDTGAVLALDSAKAVYKGLNWTEKGEALAVTRGVEDKGYEDKLYSLVAFRGFANNAKPEKIVYDPSKDSTFPKGMSISPNRNPIWMADLSAVSFGIHDLKVKKKTDEKDASSKDAAKTDDIDKPDMSIWHWKDARIQPAQQVDETRDNNFSYLSLYRVAEQKFVRLADESMREVRLLPEYSVAVGLDQKDYELSANLNGQDYTDVYSVNLKTGAREIGAPKTHWLRASSPDGSHVLYFADGNYYTLEVATKKIYNITAKARPSFVDIEDDHNQKNPPLPVIGWSKDSSAVLLFDGWDIWKVGVHGDTAMSLTGNGRKDGIRYESRLRTDVEEKGIDLSQPIYVRAYGERSKKGGLAKIDAAKLSVQMIAWDDSSYQQLRKAKNADVILYTRETTEDYPDFYFNGTRITETNPQQKDFLWTKGSRVIDYTSTNGHKLQAALFLPANYEAGKSYPTIVYIYEKLSQNTNRYPQPAFEGFSTAAYTSNGYAVLMPDIVYKLNDPGMSAVACVLPALKAGIATGVIDEKRVGLHGHSWGGYETAFLVTQTTAFKAALAGAPLTDMVSMYSSVYWNVGTPNQPIFESDQGRFTSGYLDNSEAYIRNSPVYHATNVKTPLLMMANDKDGAVDWNQGIEYYNTLRRLGKPVVMLSYKGENHHLAKLENKKDYTVRVKEFFDSYLMDKEPPKWWLEGVKRIDLKEHLEQREQLVR